MEKLLEKLGNPTGQIVSLGETVSENTREDGSAGAKYVMASVKITDGALKGKVVSAKVYEKLWETVEEGQTGALSPSIYNDNLYFSYIGVAGERISISNLAELLGEEIASGEILNA